MDKYMGETVAAFSDRMPDKEYYIKAYNLKDGGWTINEIIAYLQTIVPTGEFIDVTVNHSEKFQLSCDALHTSKECVIRLWDDVDSLRIVHEIRGKSHVCISAEMFTGAVKED